MSVLLMSLALITSCSHKKTEETKTNPDLVDFPIPTEKKPVTVEEIFISVDENRDGKISFKEADAADQKNFDKYDIDRNGKIQMGRPNKKAPKAKNTPDKNNDGQVTEKEHDQYTKKMFNDLDKNKDGSLDKAEVEGGLKPLQ